jgi:soluble lytic murein transglycosylase-like protein
MGLSSTQQRILRAGIAVPMLAVLLAGCSMAGIPAFKPAPAQVAEVSAAPVPETRPDELAAPFEPLAFAAAPVHVPSGEVAGLISKYSALYAVPESLVRRVVARESGFNPAARNGPYYGLMQIRHDTARTMGYRGEAAGLLDAETNLTYAVKYLRGAYMVANYDADMAMRFYASGYYYDAKRMGLLEEIGLR